MKPRPQNSLWWQKLCLGQRNKSAKGNHRTLNWTSVENVKRCCWPVHAVTSKANSSGNDPVSGSIARHIYLRELKSQTPQSTNQFSRVKYPHQVQFTSLIIECTKANGQIRTWQIRTSFQNPAIYGDFIISGDADLTDNNTGSAVRSCVQSGHIWTYWENCQFTWVITGTEMHGKGMSKLNWPKNKRARPELLEYKHLGALSFPLQLLAP